MFGKQKKLLYLNPSHSFPGNILVPKCYPQANAKWQWLSNNFDVDLKAVNTTNIFSLKYTNKGGGEIIFVTIYIKKKKVCDEIASGSLWSST